MASCHSPPPPPGPFPLEGLPVQLTFIACLPGLQGASSTNFLHFIFKPTMTSFCAHLTDEETKATELKFLTPKVTQSTIIDAPSNAHSLDHC